MNLTQMTILELPLVRIEGEVESSDAEELERSLREALGETGDCIILDLERCTYLGSAALGVLFYLTGRARFQETRVIAVHPSAEVLHLMQSIRLTHERGFSIFVDIQSAIEELSTAEQATKATDPPGAVT